MAFVHSEEYTVTGKAGASQQITHESENETDGGIQVGLGIQYNLNNNLFIAGEYKYQPGIFGDGHSIMASIGFIF